ncbi:hypothetical protein [Sphingomonas baiyangensis]|uniref:Lipoprotein n=1 Tax=Sphingomonas baiyangensis TaxID=2572576 RepID=A0A4U1L2Z9_9SPHN|nr:hypothetical protein [Sphingomonas baiyangensis]TKD50854.1 hypothetical protein FBR43_08805 [Sphingomonas baiyangensis]
MAMRLVGGLVAALSMAACSAAPPPDEPGNVSLRNLVETDKAAEARAGYRLQGDLMPTPSDTQSRYYLLRNRTTPLGTVVAIIRQERGDRIAYARAELDCEDRLFHVLGVGSTRGEAEADIAYDGPLRPTTGLPLREEMGRFVCQAAGKPFGNAA